MKNSHHSYLVPEATVQVEYEIKKSRFIARAAFAEDRDRALQCVGQAKADYADARHHCWAYLIGDPCSPLTAAMSDDGEPSGTAGKPILNVLQHKSVGNIVLVVIRYFGGIKLGAGGLVRAYSSAAQLAMDTLTTVEHRILVSAKVSGTYALEQPLRHWLGLHDGVLDKVVYGEAIIFDVSLSAGYMDTLHAFILARGAELILQD
ncbi:MAG: putative YigZ family protein [Lentisphaeria bacterium]|jgi:uncharacterized YigZ family protein